MTASIPLALPVAHVDGSPAELDAASLLLAAQLEEQRALLRAAPSEEMAAEVAEAVLERVKALDTSALKAINAACASNRPARALDWASQLRDPRFLEKSIQLAQHHKQMQLAERLAMLMRFTFGGAVGGGRSAPAPDELLFDSALEQGPYAAAEAAGAARPAEPARAPSGLRAHEPRASDSIGERRRLAAERFSARLGNGDRRDRGGGAADEEGGARDKTEDPAEADDAEDPAWVDDQHVARAATAASREAMRPLQPAAAGGGAGGSRASNPFAKPPADKRASTMATPGSAKVRACPPFPSRARRRRPSAAPQLSRAARADAAPLAADRRRTC